MDWITILVIIFLILGCFALFAFIHAIVTSIFGDRIWECTKNINQQKNKKRK